MKKRIILVVLIMLAFLLAGYRFMLVEREDILPETMRSHLSNFFGLASAEVIPADAAAGDDWSSFLSRLFGEMKKTPEPTEHPTPTPAPTPVPTPSPTPQPLMENGHQGDEVRAMQERLRALGFMTSAADGQFGPRTEQAVADFKEHLYLLEQENATPEPTQAPGAAPAEPTAPHETNAPAEETPPALNTEAPADSAQNIPETPVFEGKVDQETYHLLLEDGFDEYQMRLVKGSRGAEVKRLQSRLKALGYLSGAADGIYGNQTVRAVTAFQKRHKLAEDGIAGEQTQRLLFSAEALKQVKPSHPYLLKISTARQRVYAYAWDENDLAYTRLVRTMVCSTGLSDTPTPLGTFSKNTAPVVRWGYFPKWDVWAQYLYRINGSILFHSVLYTEADESSLIAGSRYKLGSPASHGCVRLEVEDAKWIYMNCPAGTTVKVV